MLQNLEDAVFHPTTGTGHPLGGLGAFALAALLGAAGCAAESSTPTHDPTKETTMKETNMNETTMTKATMIPVTAVAGNETDLRAFLESGREVVARDEPGTPYWFALEQEGGAGGFAIFDLFPDQAGRDAHFAGNVAAALARRAPELVRGGWQDGVVANVQHYTTLAQKLPEAPVDVTKATAISLQAVPGRADALADFLIAGGQMVIDGEPLTPYWLALRSEQDDHRFAIVDLFPNEAGREAHFGGAVAAALEANAEALVAGGWREGVLEHVVHFDVVAAK